MGAPQEIVSDTNLTPVVQIITWFALSTSVLAFVVHAGLKLYISKSLSLEVVAGFFALLFCSAQSLAVFIQTLNGFGKPIDSLSPETVQSQFKAEYAATILFIISLCLSKLVIVAFIRTLTPKSCHLNINMGLGAMISIWAVASIFTAAFHCGSSQPWDKVSGRCYSHLSWWYAISVFNILTDVSLVALECVIALELQLKRGRKITIISILSCRMCVSIVIIFQLVYFHRDSTGPGRTDVSLGYWRSVICNQAVQSAAIITTSLPYAKMLMHSLDSGMIPMDAQRRQGENYGKGSGGRVYELLDKSRDSARRKQTREEDKADSEQGLNTAISQTKTWTVKTESARDSSHLQHGSFVMTVPEFLHAAPKP